MSLSVYVGVLLRVKVHVTQGRSIISFPNFNVVPISNIKITVKVSKLLLHNSVYLGVQVRTRWRSSPRGKVESWLSLRLRDVNSTAFDNTPIGTFVMELCSIDRVWGEREGV